jgi:predicted RNase H-like HicB family nuclease
MVRQFTLEYWQDEGWYVGRLREIPGVFSQGETLTELEENIRDAYKMLKDDAPELQLAEVQTKEIGVEV